MKIAVCEDCMEDTLLLKHFLGGHNVSIYSDTYSLLDDIDNNKVQFDLYLLDIFMEESMSGIELAGELRKIQEEAVICFVSSSNDFYREAYDLYAVQYLLKPVREADVRKLLDKVSKSLMRKENQSFLFSRGDRQDVFRTERSDISAAENIRFRSPPRTGQCGNIREG